MANQRHLRIHITRRGRESSAELPLGPVLIGCGSHCDVRLLPDEAAEKQLSLEPCAGGVRVRNWVHEPRCTHAGRSFDEVVIEQQGVFELGALTLRIELSEATKQKAGDRGALLKNARQVVLLAGLAVGYWYVLREPPAASNLNASLPPPVLFDAPGERPCPQSDPAAALALAEEQYVLAESKRERSPFRIYDGVLAVPLYQTAAACFAAAHEAEWANEAREAATTLHASMVDQLHTHRVRLDWFLARDKYEPARAEVRTLRELLKGKSDPYTSWLSSVERELSTMIAKQAEEET